MSESILGSFGINVGSKKSFENWIRTKVKDEGCGFVSLLSLGKDDLNLAGKFFGRLVTSIH